MIRLTFAVIALGFVAAAARADDQIKIPFNVVEAGFKKAKCTNNDLQDEERTAEDLGGGLKLVEVYCWRAAYQAGSIYFAVDPKAPEKARLLRFHVWSSKAKKLTISYSLTDPSFDPKTKGLGMGHKGRGAGDCGETGRWRWAGSDFMLIGYWEKPNCDGNTFDNSRRWQVYPPRG